jgi:5'-phosphate synthase pdxT subunit
MGGPSAQVVGVLALQGAFAEHVALFARVGVRAVEVRTVEELAAVHALVLPGGESTTVALLARRWGLLEPLREWVRAGKPIWGTCAGMILLADRLTGKMQQGQETIGGFHAVVHRNYFGSQLGSFHSELESKIGLSKDHELSKYVAVFIRAPVIESFGADVQVLATVKSARHSKEAAAAVDHVEAVVAARQGNILATSFHPELTEDAAWHRYFWQMVQASQAS